MDNERGNVFFYIFMCIGLLAALSLAVSQGGRGGVDKLSEDRRRLVATEMVAFADTVAKTVSQLRLRGTAETRLSFANTFLSGYGAVGASPSDEIFNPAGGAVTYNPPPADATNSPQDYRFLANNVVQNVGSTCGTDDCIDLIMAVTDLKKEVCTRINDLIGVPNNSGDPPDDTGLETDTLYVADTNPFDAGSPETIGDEDTNLAGRTEACFEDAANVFIYYKVLMPR